MEAGAHPVVWCVQEADPGAEASLLADLHALQVWGVEGRAVVAGIPARDTVPQAIKIGRLGSVEGVHRACQLVDRLSAQGHAIPLVVDAVPDISGGGGQTSAALVQAYVQALLPRATLVTANGVGAARLGLRAGCARVSGQPSFAITGGEATGGGIDSVWFCSLQASGWLSLPRADSACHSYATFAASAAAALASGYCEADAMVLATMARSPAEPDFAQRLDNLPWLQAQPGVQTAFPALRDPALGVYAVVDSAAWVQCVLAAGIRTVQLRIKDAHAPGLASQVAQAIAMAHATPGAQLFINDHWQLALEHGAYGVHLGQEDLDRVDLDALRNAGVRLGLSTHCYWEVARAWALRPSYIACGPVFATQSKDMPWIPQGLDNLRYWANLLPLPVVGIAGIDANNVAEVAATGAASAAVISAITKVPDPAAACAALVRGFAAGAAASAPRGA